MTEYLVDFTDAFSADILPTSHVPLPSSVAVRCDAALVLAFGQSAGGTQATDFALFKMLDAAPLPAPGVVSVEVVNANAIDVVFDAAMRFDAAMTTPSSWSSSDPRVVITAVDAAGAYRARLTLSEMKGGKAYTFTAPANVVNDIGVVVAAGRRSGIVVGVGRQPRVSRAELLSSTSRTRTE